MYTLTLFVCASIFLVLSTKITHGATDPADDTKLNNIDTQIQQKQKELTDIEDKIEFYNKTIEVKQEELLSLKSELELLGTNIERTQKEIQQKGTEIQLLELEIQELKQKIEANEGKIVVQKRSIQDTLKKLYIDEHKTYLEATVSSTSFSSFFKQITYLQEVEKESQRNLDTIQKLRDEQTVQKKKVEEKNSEVKQTKSDLEVQKIDYEKQQEQRADILIETEEDEEKFQQLVEEARQEQQSIDANIRALEKKARKRLEDLQKKDGSTGDSGSAEDLLGDGSDFGGDFAPIWPVDSQTVTCSFHCGDYPFRRVFEHSGTDIAVPQGTAVKAAASGYVAIAKDGGATGYSYIMLVHGNGFSTVYGHISSIGANTLEKLETGALVRKGEGIGLSGGTPGTPGAGRFVTGPHLHFEVRKDGIPVNAEDYLP